MPTAIHITEAEAQRLRDAQARADDAYRSYGRQAPMPVHGEPALDYRRRLLEPMLKHSSTLAGANLYGVADTTTFDFMEGRIYADAVAAARSPKNVPEGTLREIRTTDAAGRGISEFFGHPDAAFGPFKVQAQRVKIRDPRHGR